MIHNNNSHRDPLPALSSFALVVDSPHNPFSMQDFYLQLNISPV